MRHRGLFVALAGIVCVSAAVRGGETNWPDIDARTPAGHVYRECELSPEKARALAKAHPVLVLDNIRFLPAAVASSLSTPYIDTFLTLPRLERIDAEAARELSGRRGHLRLWGLTELTPAVASALCSGEGQGVELTGVTKATCETLRAIVSGHRSSITLGFTELCAEQAGILAEFRGDVHLPRLSKLSTDAARCLQHHSGVLDLGGAVVSEEVSPLLLRHDGPLWLPYVRKLEPGVGDILAGFQSTVYVVLEEVDSPALAAKLFSGPYRDETVMRLRRASPLVAAELARNNLGYLPKLEELSVDAAREIARVRTRLTLDSLTNLTPDIAVALTDRDATVRLGLVSLEGPDALALAQALGESRAPVHLNRLCRVSDPALKVLEENPRLRLPAMEKLTVLREGD